MLYAMVMNLAHVLKTLGSIKMGFWLEQKKKKDRFLLWFRPKTPTLRGMVRGIEEP